MATFYTGWTEPELTALRVTLMARFNAMSASGEFQAVTVGGKTFATRAEQLADIRAEIQEVNQALQELDPTTYGTRVTKTYLRFR